MSKTAVCGRGFTRRHEGLQDVGDCDTGIRLVVFEDGADHASGGAHSGVQHVNILGLRREEMKIYINGE